MIRAARLALGLALCASLAGCGTMHHRGGKRPAATPLAPSRVTTIGVNAYLWKATLDTLGFMTIAQSDSNGGVISTEWYVNPAIATERMKVSVSILDQDLRADALRVAASRQILQNGLWIDTSVQAGTNQKLEELILQRARDLRRTAG